MSTLPEPRGALCEELFGVMRGGSSAAPRPVAPDDDGDAALALWALYELHYRGFDEVSDDLEWSPGLLHLRARLEWELEATLRERFDHASVPGDGPTFSERFFGWVASHDGPSLAEHVLREADEKQVHRLLRVRSLFHLREFDPSVWIAPRLGVRARAALAELMYDEYGAGDPTRLHAHLFARGLEACGIEPDAGRHVDEAPTEVLEQNNAMSLFGLHRRLRAAALGHLAAFEATSSAPSRRMEVGLRRLDFPEEMIGYYAEHTTADAVHEQLVAREMCPGLLEEEPGLEEDLWFGAFTCLDLEARVARRLLDEWGVAS